MELRKVEKARLEGYEKPFFPEEIDGLNEILWRLAVITKEGYDTDSLREIKEVTRVHLAVITHEEKVRYRWSFGVSAELPSGKIIILFPCALRVAGELDRSIAVYQKPGKLISLEEVNLLLERIQLRFFRQWKKKIDKFVHEITETIVGPRAK